MYVYLQFLRCQDDGRLNVDSTMDKKRYVPAPHPSRSLLAAAPSLAARSPFIPHPATPTLPKQRPRARRAHPCLLPAQQTRSAPATVRPRLPPTHASISSAAASPASIAPSPAHAGRTRTTVAVAAAAAARARHHAGIALPQTNRCRSSSFSARVARTAVSPPLRASARRQL